MMRLFRREPDHALDAVRRKLDAELPAGWALRPSDSERFTLPTTRLQTWAAIALGPEESGAIALGLGEERAALEALLSHLRGGLPPAPAWAPPLPAAGPDSHERSFGLYDERDPEVLAAREELEAALPPGWTPFDSDRERYRTAGRHLVVWAVSAAGPSGQAALVVAPGEANALRWLARRLRGELEEATAWVPAR